MLAKRNWLVAPKHSDGGSGHPLLLATAVGVACSERLL